jgi:hypothetical protein
MLKNYYQMSEELEEMGMMYANLASEATDGSSKIDRYLQAALEAEYDLKQSKIT